MTGRDMEQRLLALQRLVLIDADAKFPVVRPELLRTEAGRAELARLRDEYRTLHDRWKHRV